MSRINGTDFEKQSSAEALAISQLVKAKDVASKLGVSQKEQAIAALLTHRNIDEAAQAIGVAPATLLRWMKEADFDAAYREARRQSVHQSVARMQQATGAAGITILKLMTDPNVPAAVRLRRSASSTTPSRGSSWKILKPDWHNWRRVLMKTNRGGGTAEAKNDGEL